MLKLSALQPHLTAAEALNQRAAWIQGGRASKDSSHSGTTSRHARTQDWHAQGQELTGSHQPKRQLSVCIQLEVKLAEALDKCDSLCPPQADDHGQLLPNKLRTAVCCKVLTDLCNVSGPFSKVLRTVKTELVRSVYSDYYAMEQQGLQFSQLPYYKAAERLEADNKHLLQEKEAFKKVLLRRQEEMAVIEGQVAELKGLVQQQDALNAGLQQRVQTAGEAEARAKVEAGAAKDELKRLRKEMLRLKNEWSSLRALYESAKVREQQASEAFEAQMAELRESVRAGAEEAAELQAKLATVVPREQLTAAEQRIKELEKMVQQARRESVKADDLVRSLTPRPNWHKLDAFSQPPPSTATPLPQGPIPPLTKGQPSGQGSPAVPATQQPALHQPAVAIGSTRETVDQLVAERKQALAKVRELEPLREQLQQALSLLEPEAAPSPVQLQLVQPAVTQPQDSASLASVTDKSAAAAALAAEPAASSPRNAAVAVTPRTAAVAAPNAPGQAAGSGNSSTANASVAASSSTSTASGQTMAAVGANGTQMVEGLGWTSQVARCLRWDGHITLQPYNLQTLYTRMQNIWAAKAAFDGQRKAQHPLLGFLWTYFRAEHGEQAAVAQEGYSFLCALRQYQHQLALADMFLRVVEGQWQEGVWHDCRHMLQGVALVLEALSDSQPEGVHSLVSVVDIQLVLQHLFPLKSEADVSAAIKAVSSADQITISALMPIHRSSGQRASPIQPPSQFVEALQRQYMLDIDNRVASLQRTFNSDLSASLPVSIAKHRMLKWDSSITEAEVEGVIHDMLLSNDVANQLPSLSADVDVKALVAMVSTMTPWPRLHAFYGLESTLMFVRQLYESDGGIHSAGELPEVA
ncbi:hypothetical protein WJX77_004467 [Trebouxia sp. C0004]